MTPSWPEAPRFVILSGRQIMVNLDRKLVGHVNNAPVNLLCIVGQERHKLTGIDGIWHDLSRQKPSAFDRAQDELAESE